LNSFTFGVAAIVANADGSVLSPRALSTTCAKDNNVINILVSEAVNPATRHLVGQFPGQQGNIGDLPKK
tara:strand:+ start:322 stop:528 length:207 start_codon:yes stop_codon:yes gene_type:complete